MAPAKKAPTDRPPDPHTVGGKMWAWLAQQRLHRQQPRTENALARELGLSQKTIVGWRLGATPDAANLQKLAAIMGVDADWLLDPAESWATRENAASLGAVLAGVSPAEKRAIIEALRDPRIRKMLVAHGATLPPARPSPSSGRGPR